MLQVRADIAIQTRCRPWTARGRLGRYPRIGETPRPIRPPSSFSRLLASRCGPTAAASVVQHRRNPPRAGLPAPYQDQERWKERWKSGGVRNRRGRVTLKAGGRFKKLLTIFANPVPDNITNHDAQRAGR